MCVLCIHILHIVTYIHLFRNFHFIIIFQFAWYVLRLRMYYKVCRCMFFCLCICSFVCAKLSTPQYGVINCTYSWNKPWRNRTNATNSGDDNKIYLSPRNEIEWKSRGKNDILAAQHSTQQQEQQQRIGNKKRRRWQEVAGTTAPATLAWKRTENEKKKCCIFSNLETSTSSSTSQKLFN